MNSVEPLQGGQDSGCASFRRHRLPTDGGDDRFRRKPLVRLILQTIVSAHPGTPPCGLDLNDWLSRKGPALAFSCRRNVTLVLFSLPRIS
jgi:hypothetical protein